MTTLGWEQSTSETFSHSTGIDLSTSFGWPFADFSVSVSYDFGYNSTESFTQMGTTEDHISITAAPHSTVIMWQTKSDFILRRADGSVVKRWSRMDDSLTYDEYKHEGKSLVLMNRTVLRG